MRRVTVKVSCQSSPYVMVLLEPTIPVSHRRGPTPAFAASPLNNQVPRGWPSRAQWGKKEDREREQRMDGFASQFVQKN